MPELPEVETTILELKREVLKRTFLDVWTDWKKIIKKPSNFGNFKKLIKNKKIKDIQRKGKNIVFCLSDNLLLLVHQKMTGHLLYGQWQKTKEGWQPKGVGPLKDDPMNRFIHLIFFLDKGGQIALSDLRKFAKVELAGEEEIKKELEQIGPDPLEINYQEFKQRLAGKKGRIKQVLMDQKTISGIGNIYSDEILFSSRIHPLRRTSDLSPEELKRIYRSSRRILKKAIELRGASISDYRRPNGERGGYDKIRKVYQRQGEKCPSCGAEIKKIRIGGRSAHFCPKCQR